MERREVLPFLARAEKFIQAKIANATVTLVSAQVVEFRGSTSVDVSGLAKELYLEFPVVQAVAVRCGGGSLAMGGMYVIRMAFIKPKDWEGGGHGDD